MAGHLAGSVGGTMGDRSDCEECWITMMYLNRHFPAVQIVSNLTIQTIGNKDASG